jgi:hypothetical protein
MKTTEYERPIIITNSELAEGIYTASGSATPSCDSKYIKGVFHAPDYNNTTSYIERFGCLGCPAFRYNGCGLQSEDYWGSYDVDNGSRFPSWEKIGHEPNDAINWNDVGLL